MRKLHFGCGKKIFSDSVNVDIQKGEGIDKSFDFDKFPYPFNDNEFDYIYSSQVFEHLDNIIKVMDELYRICKNNAIIEIIVPYYNTYDAHTDLTHKHFFTDMSFVQLVDCGYSVDKKKKFEISKLELIPKGVGKIIPFRKLRKIVSILIPEIIEDVYVKLKVVK
ncbi:methyltransferase domain-containing protein [Nanoarchaeota archaeon]